MLTPRQTTLSYFGITLLSLAMAGAMGDGRAEEQDTSGIWVDGKVATTGDGSYYHPFQTVGEAIEAFKAPTDPNTRVTIRGGTYREQIKLDAKHGGSKSGTPDQPLIVRGMPGERVILSGMRQISGWKLDSGKVYVADVGEWNPAGAPNPCPENFYFGMQERPMAQSPEGSAPLWIWQSMKKDAAGNLVVTDPEHLKGVGNLTGGYIQYYSIPYQIPGATILSNDPDAGTLTVGNNNVVADFATTYIVKNLRSLVDQPGEWAFVKDPAGTYKIYYWPKSDEEVAAMLSDNPPTQVRNGKTGIVILYGIHDVVVENLEIMGSTGDGVHISGGSQNITVRNCLIHDNGGYQWRDGGKVIAIGGTGIFMRDTDGVTVTNNVITLNTNGVGIQSCKGVTVSHNDIGYNFIDGFDISSGRNLSKPTLNTTISNNYIHHHYNLLQHPDAIQTYDGGVQGLRIVDNAIFASPQIMHNGMAGGEYLGNVIWGPNINKLGTVDSLGSAGPVIFRNNTLYGGVCFYPTMPAQVTDNIFLGRLFTYPESYTGDRNLLLPMLKSPGVYDKTQIISINGKNYHSYGLEVGGGIQGFYDATQQDEHSQIAPAGEPLFVNMPTIVRVFGDVKEEQWSPTESVISLEKVPGEGSGKVDATAGMSVGGYIEFNMDGVPRKITAIDEAKSTITVTPALNNRAHLYREDIIEYWGDRTDFKRDSRLAANSPGRAMASDGGPVGSRLVIANYQSGDFDGNGTRDIPAVPADVEENVKLHDFHASPWFSFGN